MTSFGQNTTQAKPINYYPIYVDNVLNDQMIEELNQYAQQTKSEVAKIGGTNASQVNENTRRSNVVWLMPDKMPPEVNKHFETLFIDANKNSYEFELTGFESFQYTVYDEKNAGEYKWHIDTVGLESNLIRKLSMSLLLSDPSEYEGGQLVLIPDGNHFVAPEKKGRAVFFPSWMPHCVLPVTKGTRKSLVIWAHGPKLK